ncbi:diguanylate cyclase, partial [Phyllobacterium sp. SB3]|uniref:putative bifunctional diguanylate cyclase/phosphodiesterase n=1 Tax=Phyllobacterium sp. SB3 TaxID=3156073 RepID=UPI0032B0073B
MSKLGKTAIPDANWPDQPKLLRTMIDQVPDYLFVKDVDCRFVIANEAVAHIHGFDNPDEMSGKTDFDLHDAISAARFLEIERRVIFSGIPMVDMEERVIDAVTGKERWLSTTKVAMRNDENLVVGLVGISRDITARKQGDFLRDEQAAILEMIAVNFPLEVILDRLVRMMESQLEGVFGSILLMDENGTRLKHGAGPTLPQAYSRAIDGLVIGPDAGSCGTAAYRSESVIVADISTDPLWINFRDLAAAHQLRSCWSAPILSHQGTVLGTFALYSADVRSPGPPEINLTTIATRIAAIAIERKLAEDRIRFMAYHDMLTGLPNRILLTDRLTQAMLQSKRHNPWVSVVFIDLDNFKFVNDSLGHTAGDELLKVVAQRMLACVRSTDAVVRLGGDEFVILLTDLPANADGISAAMHKIRAAIAEPVIIANQPFHVTCSMGVATFPQDGTDAETLIANADVAMYKAKDTGRDSFQFFTPEMNIKAHERLALQDGIRKGIARSEFYLLYQPQIHLKSGRIFAVEALVRWQHPVLGLVLPNEFIPLAEETG